ncbi:ras and EF-hand domain-containing protein-like isoform X1 [Branchiostoma floridae]|uniref:Ras and EF-hand domain-containing protein-like isoform X1 n=2 Tax=Branchiostoma floridae TaxID=7739 RepID=A0A9J7KKM3_BRAFL|nr:ras and EF-hand domain-containing protein-like isoform X1 [Branchiostoma floridae]
MAAAQSTEVSLSTEELQEMMVQKAQELFSLCDKEAKGFITKRDMQRLVPELPLSPDQLEDVFDHLDQDGNGFLTMQEFTDGFGCFLGFDQTSSVEEDSAPQVQVYEAEEGEDQALQKFQDFMDSLEIDVGLLENYERVREMWLQLNLNSPELLGNFEDFLRKMVVDLRSKQQEHSRLEDVLRSKSSEHDEEVQRLYEEMEQQIKMEKDKIKSEELSKEKQAYEDLKMELEAKDSQLHDILLRQRQLEQKLQELNLSESQTKQLNQSLTKTNEALQNKLHSSLSGLKGAMAEVQEWQEKADTERKQKTRTAWRVTAGMVKERESLVKQLDLLKNMNQKLRDDKDEYETIRKNSRGEKREVPVTTETRPAPLARQGSSLSKYLPASSVGRTEGVLHSFPSHLDPLEIEDDGIEYDVIMEELTQNSFDEDNESTDVISTDLQSINPTVERSISRRHPSRQLSRQSRIVAEENHGDLRDSVENSEEEMFDIGEPRGQPVGGNTVGSTTAEQDTPGTARMFKVVFVGDSGVGKSTFIYRVCHDDYKATFSSTIGVDFHLKTVVAKNQKITMQLWDTAGQERFRSITKSYFRKADGVIIMYDVSTEPTFTSVRSWMESIQEGTSEDTVLMLVGNKVDLLLENDLSGVKSHVAKRLAQEYDALFFESSAKTGVNITEAVLHMAGKLCEKEDQQMEKALNLEEAVREKRCCKM